MSTGFLTTLILFLPMVGFTILLFLNEKEQKEAIKWTAFGFSIITFVLSLVMWAGFDNSVAGLQFVQRWTWIDIAVGGVNIISEYYVGVDGLSILLVVLTTFIMPIAIMGSFRAGVLEERGRQKLYYALLLLLEWAMLGVFFIQDLIVFYVFWEVTLVPMYFLIGIWGSEERVYAAVKFFLYTMAGSILMLIAILFVGNYTNTFVLPEITAQIAEFAQVENSQADLSFWNYSSSEEAMAVAQGDVDFVGRARDEARRLERLLADLTVDSRPPRERTVELAGVLERAAGLTLPARRARGIELRIADTDLAVWADEDKLLQALINLLENAAVHGPPDATVEVEVRREGPVARVEVLDEGVAYPAERYERLFEPRAQGGPKAKGTGLGLYIVRSVATDWGGEAWGGPRLGAKTGNSFGISVPLAPRQG